MNFFSAISYIQWNDDNDEQALLNLDSVGSLKQQPSC